ncbi:hypothetical protein ACXR0O_21650 [Verrucomicrobiota bacterium sgz303538]
MKPLTTLIAGVLAGITLAGTALAQQPITIYIAGANADRATTNTAIPKLLTGTLTFAGTNSDPTKANYATWTGGSFNGTPVTIKASYLGATAGIAGVGGSLPVRFLPDGATGGSNADPTVGSNPNEAHVPDVAMSSQFVSSSPYIGQYEGHFYEDLTPGDQIVSVLGFKWVASKGFPADNITPQQAQLLFASGAAPLALFTGNPADKDKVVYATGRNLDSGARFVAQGEAAIGIFSTVKHYKPTISGAAAGVGGFVTGGTVDSQVLWPVETVSGVSSRFPGNSGAATGSALAASLTAILGPNAYKAANPNATAGYYISYLSTQDADTIAIPNGAVELKWNGVPYSDQAVREGRYTLWSYEHLFYRSSTSGIQKTFGDALANQIKTVDASVSGIFLNTMKVSRQGEGLLVTPNYF